MSNALFQANGSQAARQSRYAPIWTSEWFTGLFTQCNPLHAGGVSRAEERFYGSRTDTILAGQNVEISNRRTPVRRPGCTPWSTATYSDVDSFYEFRLFNTNTEQVKVMVDTAPTLYADNGTTRQTVLAKSAGAGQTFMQYVANVLYFGNGVDQKKWLQSPVGWQAAHNYQTLDGMETYFIDGNGNLQQLTACVIPVVNVALNADVLTVTFNQDVSAILEAGLNLVFANLANATWLNDVEDQTISIASVSGSTITAGFIANNYASTPDTGTCRVLEGGKPLTSSVAPTWNPTLMGTTVDNTALWTNRGTPLENFGIKGPASEALAVDVGVATQAWKGDTYYSPLSAIIDSNGNLQQTTTAGRSGKYTAGHPAWVTTVGGTTTDGTVVWTLAQTAAEMTWQAGAQYKTGDVVVATPAGGVPSVFQVQGFRAAVLSSAVEAYIWTVPTTGAVGAFQLPPGTTLSSAVAHATGNSLMFDWTAPGNNTDTTPMQWATLDPAGNITGSTTPFPSITANFNMVVLTTIAVPEPGNYTFTLTHKDGLIWGIGGGATKVSGPDNDPFNRAATIVNNYTLMGGTNQSGAKTDSFVVNFPAAGDYPIEIDYAYWYHSNRTLVLTMNGYNPVPGDTPTYRTSGSIHPTWPTFSTAFAPGYALVSEAQGQLEWANLGPVTDFAWTQKTNYLVDATSIVDGNGYIQAAFETGVTSTTAPSFSQVLNALTPDNPNLIWINKGRSTITPAGNISTYAGGWSYCIALVNTLTDTVSNAGPVTLTTGSFLGASGVTLTGGVPATGIIDPQVDYVAIFRTKDGGANFYLIPSTATVNSNQNTVYTMPLADYLANGFVDTVADADLNILIQAPLSGENTPPPDGIVNLAYHLGRIFGSVGNVVQWSSGPDAPVGNGNEGFPPANSATFPSLVKRIVPTSVGALVFTVSDIYLIAGRGTSSSPLFPQSFAEGIGLLSYNALTVTGTTIYMMTADREVVRFVPGGEVEEVGFAIGDQFSASNWDPAKAYLSWHKDGSQDHALYVSDGATGWFRMHLTPETSFGVAWSPFASIVGGVKAVQSVEVQPGVRKLLLGPTSVETQPVLKRDLSVWSDNGQAYSANFTMGSLVLAHPGQIAEVAFVTLEAQRAGSAPTPSVLFDEISGSFESLPNSVADPPQLAESTSLYARRHYVSQTGQPALCRHMQLEISWPAEAAANEMLTMTLFGSHAAEAGD